MLWQQYERKHGGQMVKDKYGDDFDIIIDAITGIGLRDSGFYLAEAAIR